MTLNKIIATLQSNIARRGIELADLETIYSIRRATAYTKHQYRVIRAVREQIAPLAKAQKFDRTVLRELTNSRTLELRKNITRENMYHPMFWRYPSFYITSVPAIEPVFEQDDSQDITKSNKFSFPG